MRARPLFLRASEIHSSQQIPSVPLKKRAKLALSCWDLRPQGFQFCRRHPASPERAEHLAEGHITFTLGSLEALAPLGPHSLLLVPSPPAPDTAHLPPLIHHVDAETARAEACSTSCVFVECLKAKSHSPFPRQPAPLTLLLLLHRHMHPAPRCTHC